MCSGVVGTTDRMNYAQDVCAAEKVVTDNHFIRVRTEPDGFPGRIGRNAFPVDRSRDGLSTMWKIHFLIPYNLFTIRMHFLQ